MLPPLKAPEKEHITGDWVLFHPVYTPSELKAVEVGGACGGLCDVAVFSDCTTCTGAPQATTNAI
jgi:hypothetical protein